MRQEALADLIAEVATAPLDTTAEQLVQRLEIAAEGTLGKLEELRKTLAMYKIEIVPRLTTGELTTVRLLRFQSRPEIVSANEIQKCIDAGESAQLEFKATLLYHTKKQVSQPGLPNSEYRSEDVLHSALKTIAAYLNSSGGVLLIGVSDDQTILGIERDYCFSDTANQDKWELHLRNCVRGKFKDGASVNDYVETIFRTFDGKTVAFIRVTRRGKLNVLRDPKGQNQIYRRQGNQTTAVDAVDIEEFIEERSRARKY
jgi:hypothetical protein